MYELTIYRGLMCHDNEEWVKICSRIDLPFQNSHEQFDKFWPEHSNVSKMFTLMGCFWPNYIMFQLKKSTEELCLMALKIDVKFEGKLTCAFSNDMRNSANFHMLKNSDFILESKIAELNQNKNPKHLDRQDAVRKIYFTLEINK